MELLFAGPEHLPAIRQIAYDTWPDTFGTILTEEQIAYMLGWMYSLESLEKQTKELGHRFILAEEDGSFYGYASFETNYGNKPLTKIHKIYILPDNQGKSIGKQLIGAIQTAALGENNLTLTLNVNRNNKALGFYKKLGFEVAGSEDIDIGNGFKMEDFILNKDLRPI